MTRVGVLVQVSPPPGMSADQAVREITNSVRFGEPEVQLLFVRHDEDETDSP